MFRLHPVTVEVTTVDRFTQSTKQKRLATRGGNTVYLAGKILIARWDVDEHSNLECQPIEVSLFDGDWDDGFFARNIVACDTIINDYDSEWIRCDVLPAARVVIVRYRSNPRTRDLNEFLGSLLK